MTFDEAIEKIESITDELNIRQEVINDVVSVVEGLRKEYAPTIEMTYEQKEYYASRTLLSGLVFNQNTQYYTDEVHNIPREIALAILHPETIKVVDE